MIFTRMFAFVIAVVAAVPWGTAGAASGSYDLSAGGARCAYASGKVSGGTAWVEICQGGDAGPYGDVGDAPNVDQAGLIWGEAHVSTTRGRDDRSFQLNPSSPNQSQVAGFVMDPGMNTAQIQLAIGTITINVTLTARTEAPTPIQYLSLSDGYHESAEPEPVADAYAFASVDAGVYRRATVTGSITSSSRGGGALSQASGSMYTGAGAGADACVTSSDWSFGCFFIGP